MIRRLPAILTTICSFVLSLSSCAQNSGDSFGEAIVALNSGKYMEARRAFESLIGSDTTGTAVAGLATTYLATGARIEGLDALQTLVRSDTSNAFFQSNLGRLQASMGRLEAAEQSFRYAARLDRRYWRNAIELADLFHQTGRTQDARRIYGTIWNAYKQGLFRTSEQLSIAGRASARVEEFNDANGAFRTAYDVDPRNVDNLYHWGELYRQKFNTADAQRTLEEGLAISPNNANLMVALAMTRGFAKKEELARRALSIDPGHPEAHGILASIRILDGSYEEAISLANAGLETNPTSLSVRGHLAAAQFLLGNMTEVSSAESAALNTNPQAVEFYTTIAEDLALRFRYPDAVTFSEKAVAVDRSDPKALASLGTGLMRLGRFVEAQRYLDQSFDRDPYNVFVGNTLTLLDEHATFQVLESEHFRVMVHESEADIVGTEILTLAEEAYAAMAPRFGYVLDDKILIEAYNDSDDFAVSVAGIPHLGLLGVCFGDVLAINTPRALPGRPYNMARTLWHEIAHTMAIGVADHRVPRWFTEGLSVYEEQQARPEWKREMELEFFGALDQDRLHPLEEIDRGFSRPEFPGQVLLSYFHASKVIEFIVDNHGFEAITGILNGLAEDLDIEQSINRATGQSRAQIDQGFMAQVKTERAALASILDGMPDLLSDDQATPLSDGAAGGSNAFLEALRAGHEALDADDLDQAKAQFEQAISIYPDFAGAGNPHVGLAEVYRRQNDNAQLAASLERFLSITDFGVEESRELAELYERRGELNNAAQMLTRSLHVDPYDAEARSRLAEIYSTLGSPDRAVSQRLAILALDPVDRAQAFYELANSLYDNRQIEKAKRAVLQSLELAPGFRDAQKLLLRCVEP